MLRFHLTPAKTSYRLTWRNNETVKIIQMSFRIEKLGSESPIGQLRQMERSDWLKQDLRTSLLNNTGDNLCEVFSPYMKLITSIHFSQS